MILAILLGLLFVANGVVFATLGMLYIGERWNRPGLGWWTGAVFAALLNMFIAWALS